MTVTWSWSIEACIGAGIADLAGNQICDLTGAEIHDMGWADLTVDTLNDEAVEWDQGIGGAGMTDLVAQSGTLTFVLDNSEANSIGRLGAYSFGHANVRAVLWKRGCEVRIGITKGGVTDYYLYYVSNCEPTAGAFLERKVTVTATDWISKAARHGLARLPVQVNQRPDQVLQTLIGAAADPPINYVLNTEPQTIFAYSLHDEADEKTKLLTVLQKVAQSSGGSIFIDSDSDEGETLRYEHRLMRPSRSVIAAFSDTMSALEVSWPIEDVVDGIKVTYNPGKVDTSDVVLAEITTKVRLAPGQRYDFDLRYRDPNGLSNRVSALSIAEQVAGTDYKASALEDGTGSDLSASLVVTLSVGANSASVGLYNNATVTMYVNTFQLRGKGLYLYEALSYVQGVNNGENPFNYNSPYMSTYWDAKNQAELLYTRMSDATRPTVGTVGFSADYDDTFFGYYRSGHIGYPYTLTETVTGLSTRKFYINKRKLKIEKGRLLVEWLGEPADQYSFLRLDTDPLDSASYVLA